MARKKLIAESPETEVLETEVEVATEESAAKKGFRAFIEAYKVQNPVKYKLKEQELLSKLNKL